MPQLRKDPIVSRWVIIATERARRPAAFVDPSPAATLPECCPFCHDHHSVAILTHENVKVLKSGTPIFSESHESALRKDGLYQSCHSHGSHEVVIETPDHVANMADLSEAQVRAVFKTYALRMAHHHTDKSIKYVLAYKNYGVAAGSRNIGHARSQIMAIPVLPMRVQDKMNGAKLYFNFHERSLFYDLVRQEQKEKQRVVLETDHFIAICPFAARFPFEVWILPKDKRQHHDYVQGIVGLETELASVMRALLLKYKIGLNDPAYNFVIQSAPSDMDTPQCYSWHIELLPRLTRTAGFERGTGFYINPIPPEMTAAYLREVKV